ncbi:hypothetical protein ACHAWX_006746 [Stephanocyclus meneghinianus]
MRRRQYSRRGQIGYRNPFKRSGGAIVMTDENALDDWGILCFVWLIRLVSMERNWMLNWENGNRWCHDSTNDGS